MSDTASPTTTLTSIVSNLGGPRVNPSDIEWANDITSGKLLINWLVAQLDPEAANSSDDLEIQHRAALRDIALEDEELKMCVRYCFSAMQFMHQDQSRSCQRWHTGLGRC